MAKQDTGPTITTIERQTTIKGNTTTSRTITENNKGKISITNSTTTNTNLNPKNKINTQAIAGLIPSARKLIPILVFLPLIIFAITMLLDLPNVTFWHTVTINGQTQWHYNWLAYFKNIDDAGQVVKNTFARLNITGRIKFDLPNKPIFTSDVNNNILAVLKYAANMLINMGILIINLVAGIFNLFSGLATLMCALIMIFVAVMGFNTEQIWLFDILFQFYKWVGGLQIPIIPYVNI